MASWIDGWVWTSAACWMFGVFFWALIVFGAVALARWLFSSDASLDGVDRTPFEILKERYAGSEITRDQG